MNRYVLKTTAMAAALGLASISFANEAQPELQPTPLEIGWFKRPVEATSYVMHVSPSTTKPQDYRFLTDHAPQ